MIDIGVNLTHPSLIDKLDENIHQWQSAGISQIIAIASDLEESAQLIEIANKNLSIKHTLGCHPHHADHWNHHSITTLRQLFNQSPHVVAIGETGLDFNRNYSSPENQIRAFDDQIQVSKSLKCPLYLHERDAQKVMIDILKNHFDDEVNGVLHCFTANKECLKSYLDLGLHIGITGWICDERRGQDLQEAIKYIPKDKLLLETDAPYLLPRSLRPRPKKNHPKHLPHIAKEAAFYADISEGDLIEITRNNTKRLFSMN